MLWHNYKNYNLLPLNLQLFLVILFIITTKYKDINKGTTLTVYLTCGVKYIQNNQLNYSSISIILLLLFFSLTVLNILGTKERSKRLNIFQICNIINKVIDISKCSKNLLIYYIICIIIASIVTRIIKLVFMNSMPLVDNSIISLFFYIIYFYYTLYYYI